MHSCTLANIGTMCVLSAHEYIHDREQIVNVYAFNETRNVIQCKLGDELEMNQTNERIKKLFNALHIKKKKQHQRVLPLAVSSGCASALALHF